MPKLEQRVLEFFERKRGSETLREDEKWCIYMKYRHEERAAELVGKLSKEEEGIMRAEKAVTGISRDYQKFAREMAITKNRMDRAQERYEGHKEGREEGKVEGRVEGETHKALAIAQNMIDLGLPFETIISATQLDPEKVKALYKMSNK
jgi:predicted transposase/invertase (TIGR01784 family)